VTNFCGKFPEIKLQHAFLSGKVEQSKTEEKKKQMFHFESPFMLI